MKILFSHSLRRFFDALPRGFYVSFAAGVFFLLATHPAFAQLSQYDTAAGDDISDTLGAMFCNAQYGIGPFADLFSVVAYCAGAAFMGQGIHMLVRYYDNPPGMPISQPLTRIGGATLLFAMPSVTEAIVQTFFGVSFSGGLTVCAPQAVTPTSSNSVGLDTLLTNLVSNIENPFNMLISMGAIVIGAFMILRGLLAAGKYGVDPRTYSMTKILSNMIVGSLLMVAGQSFNVLLNTLFDTGGVGITSGTVVTSWNFITDLNASTQFITAVQDAGYFFEMVGTLAFVRGWMIVKGAAEGNGQATMAQGLTHIVGGVLSMNIFGFLQIMDNTFGTNFLSG